MPRPLFPLSPESALRLSRWYVRLAPLLHLAVLLALVDAIARWDATRTLLGCAVLALVHLSYLRNRRLLVERDRSC